MRERRLLASVLAVIATAGAVSLRALLTPWLGFELPYITFFGAVMAAAWYGGLYPGLLATVLSAAATLFWFVTPAWSVRLTEPSHIIGVVLFVLTGALMSVAAERLLSARQQIEALRARDHSERSAADRARALLAAVVESSEDAILTKSLQGTILSWNAGAEQMFGYPAAEAVGSHVRLIVPAGRRDEEADILTRVSRGERVLPFETERVAKNGTVLDVSVTLSPIRGDSGAIIGASSIARDIGARKALEGSLRDADRRKDDFLAVLAHELRNPLAPVRSSVALLKLGAVDDVGRSGRRRDRSADAPHGPAARRSARRLADHPRPPRIAPRAGWLAGGDRRGARDHPAACSTRPGSRLPSPCRRRR